MSLSVCRRTGSSGSRSPRNRPAPAPAHRSTPASARRLSAVLRVLWSCRGGCRRPLPTGGWVGSPSPGSGGATSPASALCSCRTEHAPRPRSGHTDSSGTDQNIGDHNNLTMFVIKPFEITIYLYIRTNWLFIPSNWTFFKKRNSILVCHVNFYKLKSEEKKKLYKRNQSSTKNKLCANSNNDCANFGHCFFVQHRS